MNRPMLLLLAALPVYLGACSTPPSAQLERLYEQSVNDSRRGDFSSLEERANKRVLKVRGWLMEDEIQSPNDRYIAAHLLYESQEMSDLDAALELALSAFEDGVEDGVRVAAHCMDKMQVQRGLPQRFGTQVEWIPVIKQWRLYEVDPETTDEERAAFGISSLADLRRRVDDMNG